MYLSIAFLSSCISITHVKSVSEGVAVESNSLGYQDKIDVFLIGNPKCITEGQRDSIKQSVMKYFPLDSIKKVSVKIREANHDAFAITFANYVVFLGTLTIIPLYTSADYFIDITVFDKDGKNVKHYKGVNNEKTLFSILMLPAVPFNNMISGRRINMDRAIYEASKGNVLEDSADKEPVAPIATPVCTKAEEIYARQLW